MTWAKDGRRITATWESGCRRRWPFGWGQIQTSVQAGGIASDLIPADVIEEELRYPVTTGTTDHPGGYAGALTSLTTKPVAVICVIGDGAVVGHGDDLRPNRNEPERLYAGLTLVGKQARVPRRVQVGRNCRIDPGVVERDFRRRRTVPSGETVARG